MKLKSKVLIEDSITGFNIFLVSLPLCIAICVICKLPLYYVALSSLIGAALSSPNNVAGPALRFAPAIVFCVYELGSYSNFLTALFFGGLIQFIIGVLRIIPINTFLPNAVVKSILVAFGLLLIVNYLPLLLGYSIEDLFSSDYRNAQHIEKLKKLGFMFSHPDAFSTVSGVAALVLIMLSFWFKKRYNLSKYIPFTLLATLAAVTFSLLFFKNDSDREKVLLLQESTFLESWKLNDFLSLHFSIITEFKFWLFVALIAIFLSIETLFCVETINYLKRDQNLDLNKSLFRQGVGNMLCSLCGVIPITSRVLSSSIQLNAEVNSNRSALIYSAILISGIVFFPSAFSNIPLSIFAATILYFSFGLISRQDYRNILSHKYYILIPFLTVLLCFLYFGIQIAMISGLVVSLAIIAYNFKKVVFHFEKNHVNGRILHKMILPSKIYFFNKGFVHQYLSSVKSGSKIVIDRSENKDTHVDVEEVIEGFVDQSKDKDIQVEIVN